MVTWITLLCVAVLVFASRFLLMEPWLPLKLSDNVQQILRFSAPAVLTAIAAPIVFIRDEQISLDMDNHYLVASVVVVVVAIVTRSTMLTVVSGMTCFLFLRHMV